MTEVVTTDEWKAWHESLDAQADDAVTASVDALASFGVDLGHPRTSAIKGSKVGFESFVSRRVVDRFGPSTFST